MSGKIRMIPNKCNVLIKFEFGTINNCELVFSFLVELQIQWVKKVFSQPPIVQVLPLKKMREACTFHHRYTSTMRDKIRKKKSRKSHCRIFREFICKLW